VFTGANGTGKTNLLEAVSLLVPGRGLRAARFCDLARHGAAGPWGVAADFTGETPVSIGTGAAEPASERRAFLLDGAKPRTQADIAARLCAVWLTPQMDRLFTDSAGGRRRFLDRLVIALEPFHARALAAFEAAAAQRRRLLIEGADDHRAGG
jgi:DNA replication and repair protein RecF